MPYLYGISSCLSLIISQIFFKLLSSMIHQSTVLSIRAFLLLILNTLIIINNTKYK